MRHAVAWLLEALWYKPGSSPDEVDFLFNLHNLDNLDLRDSWYSFLLEAESTPGP
jgi:hypothetical protein